MVAVAALAGLFRPLDKWLTDARFGIATRPPTGSVVFVEIDPASLRQVGVWPWPRHLYADLIDRLMAMGAAETVLDIDFSSASTPTEDAALEAALQRAGGYALLAGFRQLSPVSGRLEVTLPLPRFRVATDTVMLNVLAEPDGVVRRYPLGTTIEGKYYPSLAAALASRPNTQETVYLDYGIDASAIDRIAFGDVLAGRVDAGRIAGKQVVIGASAQELRDLFTVPRFGTVPGSLLQILAAETVKQHRSLRSGGQGLPLSLVLMFAVLFLALRTRAPLRLQVGGAIAALLLVEGAAFVLQDYGTWLLRTASVDVALFGFAAAAVLWELEAKRRLHAAAARERDATRRILDQVVADNFDGVMIINSGGCVLAASRIAEQLLGDGAPLPGRLAAEVLPEGMDIAVLRALTDGTGEARTAIPFETTLTLGAQRRTLEYVATPSEAVGADGFVHRVVCLSFRDVSDRRRNEERLAFLANHDPLTGALSRLAFVHALEAMLAGDADRDQGLTVAMLDLGRFRLINEMFGHSYGDEILREVVRRLELIDFPAIGRIGGDTFAVACRGLLSAAQSKTFGQAVIEQIAGAYSLDDRRVVLSAHAGITTSAASGFDGEVLLSHAEMALASAQAVPGNAAEVFATEMTLRLADKQDLEAALRQAIAERQLAVHYQPQVELATGELIGVEALLRWHHPVLGDISPARFIPIAEETGLILELGRFVLRTACREAAGWPKQLRLAVNVSPIQFELGDMVAEVHTALGLSGLPAGRLDLEITEGLFVGQGHPANLALERLRLLGVGVAIDDFGTGYSSLAYLGRLPVDKLKIDRSFICNLPEDEEARALVAAMLTLGRTLGKQSIAEGIETAEQATFLHDLGCELGQGYFYGKPMAAADLLEMLVMREEPGVAAMAG